MRCSGASPYGNEVFPVESVVEPDSVRVVKCGPGLILKCSGNTQAIVQGGPPILVRQKLAPETMSTGQRSLYCPYRPIQHPRDQPVLGEFETCRCHSVIYDRRHFPPTSSDPGQIWPPFPASYRSMGSQGPVRDATGVSEVRTPRISEIAGPEGHEAIEPSTSPRRSVITPARNILNNHVPAAYWTQGC
jgi:hypothetical protein